MNKTIAVTNLTSTNNNSINVNNQKEKSDNKKIFELEVYKNENNLNEKEVFLLNPDEKNFIGTDLM
jgi:hypothetical protein